MFRLHRRGPKPAGKEFGAIAQLGERLNGIQEVVGSIPSGSTNKIKGLAGFLAKPFFFAEAWRKHEKEIRGASG